MQQQAIRKASINRFWVWLRWLAMLPVAYAAFFTGAIFGGVIGRLLGNRFDSYAIAFCGVYAAILTGAFIAPSRWLAAKILSLLGLCITAIGVICYADEPVEPEQNPPYLAGGIACMAISAGLITARRWWKDKSVRGEREEIRSNR